MMMYVILNNTWKQHPTKQQFYGRLPSISQTIQEDEQYMLVIAGKVKAKSKAMFSYVGRSAKKCIHQLYADTGCRLENLPSAIANRGWRLERVKGIRVVDTSWWWEKWIVSDLL